MRPLLACAIALCLVSPVAHAQTYDNDGERRINQMWDEFDAYREGVDSGRAELRREQEQGWSRSYSSGCR